MKRKNVWIFTAFLLFCLPAAACGRKEEGPSVEVLEEKSGSIKAAQDASAAGKEKEAAEETDPYVPDKETVLALRAETFEGMSEEDIADFTELVKAANLELESRMLNDNLEKKLSDPEHILWKIFEETGDIRIGWGFEEWVMEKREAYGAMSDDEFGEKFGQPVTIYNPFDGEDFIRVTNRWKEKMTSQALKTDLEQMNRYMESGVRDHKAEDIMKVYRMLHDLDYFLLRYGPEDVGQYTRDDSTVCRFYGECEVHKTIIQNSGS